MKTKKLIATVCMIAGSLLFVVDGNSQVRKLPDGSVISSDGSRRLPNGTVVYRGGNSGNYNRNTNRSRGNISVTNGETRYGNDRRNTGRTYERGLPPGQAKKVYGGSARDYARGRKHDHKEHHHDEGRHERD